jgi:hypothetical protein
LEIFIFYVEVVAEATGISEVTGTRREEAVWGLGGLSQLVAGWRKAQGEGIPRRK